MNCSKLLVKELIEIKKNFTIHQQLCAFILTTGMTLRKKH